MSEIHHATQDLAHNAVELIRQGKRDKRQIAELERALQMFRENRLDCAMPKGLAKDMTPEKAFAFFDTLITNVGFSEDVVCKLHEEGVRYCGELFEVDQPLGWGWGRVSAQLRQLVIARGFPVEFNPYEYGWEPAYQRDFAVIAAWNASIVTLRPMKRWNPHDSWQLIGTDRPRQFVGHEIVWSQKSTEHGILQKLQRSFTKSHPVLHSHMRLPKDWQPLSEHCPEYVSTVALDARAEAFCKSMGRPEWNAFHGAPNKWDGDVQERLKQLAVVLRTEGMSPYYFRLVVLWGRTVVDVRTSVKDFLLRHYRQHGESDPMDEPNRRSCLLAWGLNVHMREDEFSAIFGKDA
ncbi:MAG: hypothetical protein AAB663_03225 [Patescibacteria group bacterium]